MLLVLCPDLVDTGFQVDRPRLGVHVGRGAAPDDELAVEPDVEPVVAGAVQLDHTGLRHVPETEPARAEEPARQGRIVFQKVEGDVRADVRRERHAREAGVGEDLPAQAGPLRQAPFQYEEEPRQGCRDCHIGDRERSEMTPQQVQRGHGGRRRPP